MIYEKAPSAKYYTFEDLLETDGYLIYTNVGVSMLPLIRQKRDIIEIHAKGNNRCRKYDVVLYKRGEKYLLHRIVKVHPDDYVIVGDNCIWREYGIKDDQILGVMTRVVRDGKSITTDNILYKVYVHLWVDFYYIRATILYTKLLFHNIKHKIKRLFTTQ